MRRWIEVCPFVLLICSCYGSRAKNATSAVTRLIRSVGFPQGSGMGLFFAVGIPLDIPDKSVSLAFYFEANYILPNDKNSTYFDYDEYYRGRGLDRRTAYEYIQNKLESAGYPGRRCLLRAICEASNGFLLENGLVGDILHIFLTPSSSRTEVLPSEIIKAENFPNCYEYCDCSLSIVDLFTHIQ
ncbi:uncharacterized protein LOC135171168 isoform X2 [Diachasmimorpha longicaudata]|uniref:uncharacterized protein LOC135171168 isoform X2 n=1 Tax=Diachasmimorpha longicaudata TaxID=58733 RepID=UPI0030B87187